MPPGVGKSGNCGLPSTSVRLQRRAISTVFSRADGRSANSRCISAADLKYWSRVNLRCRRGLARMSPSAMQIRASWASQSSPPATCTTYLAPRSTPFAQARPPGAARPPGQDDQALGQLLQPGPVAQRLVFDDPTGPGAG